MPIVTNHAKRRMNGRIGITKGNAIKHAKKVLREGIRHEDTLGVLHKWMDGEFLKYHTANNMRYYAGKLYIFNSEILITVLTPNGDLESNLEQYVKEQAYIRYRKYRNVKERKEEDKRKNKEKQEKEASVLYNVSVFSRERYPDIIITKAEFVNSWMIRINYVSDNNFLDWNRYTDIITYVKEHYNITAYLRKVRYTDGKHVSREEWLKIKS